MKEAGPYDPLSLSDLYAAKDDDISSSYPSQKQQTFSNSSENEWNSSSSDPLLPHFLEPMEIESLENDDDSSNFLYRSQEDNFPWHSNAIYFLLVSLPYYLLNLPKFLWFEAERFHRARLYTSQLLSFSFLFSVVELSLFLLSRDENSSHMVYAERGGFGSLNREDFLCKGEGFRLFSHLFLHFHQKHLASNLKWQLWYCGYYHVLFGSWTFLLLWFMGGLFGGLNHVLFREGEVCGANASICSLHSAYLVWILYHAKETPPSFLRTYLRNCNFAIISFYLFAVLWFSEEDSSSSLPDQLGGGLMGLLLGIFCFKALEVPREEDSQMIAMMKMTSAVVAFALVGGSCLWLVLKTRQDTCSVSI